MRHWKIYEYNIKDNNSCFVNISIKHFVFIGFGIIKLGVYTVEYARELPRTLVENCVKSVGIPRVQNFTRIRGTYGSYPVCGLYGTLHKVYVAVVLNKRRCALRYTENLVYKLLAVCALVLDVVYCKHGLDVFISGAACIH